MRQLDLYCLPFNLGWTPDKGSEQNEAYRMKTKEPALVATGKYVPGKTHNTACRHPNACDIPALLCVAAAINVYMLSLM